MIHEKIPLGKNFPMEIHIIENSPRKIVSPRKIPSITENTPTFPNLT